MSTRVSSTGTEFTTTRVGGSAPNTVSGSANIINGGASQIHVWGSSDRDETIHIGFENITSYTKGHHIRAEGKYYASQDAGWDGTLSQDKFNFTNLNEVSSGGIVVGRFEDFDPTHDSIFIGGTSAAHEVNLTQGSGYIAGNSWKVVQHNGGHNGSGNAEPQYWLVITTSSGGHVVYALESARVDGSAPSTSGGVQEPHFVDVTGATEIINSQAVSYQNPENYVPLGMTTTSGIIYNDNDTYEADVTDFIKHGGVMHTHDDNDDNDLTLNLSGNDLIAGGVNNDTIKAHSGNDQVWGGSGDDTIKGGSGNDILFGGSGNDDLTGDSGNDLLFGGDGEDILNGYNEDDQLFGQDGNDRLYGNSGDDYLAGGNGNDVMNGHSGDDHLHGGNGNDRLYGSTGVDDLIGGSGHDRMNGGTGSDTLSGQSGNDLIAGQAGQDFATGGSGEDTFVFYSGDLINWRDTSGTVQERSLQLDIIHDFVVGEDTIRLSGLNGVDDMSDLRSWRTTIDGNEYFTVRVYETNERILVDVEDGTTRPDFFNASNFDFG